MIEKLMHKYALSRQGVKDLIKGVVACTLQNISFMFPVTLLYLFVKALLNGNVRNNTTSLSAERLYVCLSFFV